ncbi:MAG: cytochrome P450 [Myxococcales bacterium]
MPTLAQPSSAAIDPEADMTTTALPALTAVEAPKIAPLFPGHPIFGAGREFQKDAMGTFFRATEACGDVARLRFPLAPYTAHVLRHPDAVRHVLVDNAKNYGKQTRGYQKLRNVLGNGLVTSEGDFWKRQRRIANPAFHRERIAHFAEVMVDCAEKLVDGWQPRLQKGEPFDVSKEMMRVTLRVIGLTMLSTDVEGEAASAVGSALDEVLHLTVSRIYDMVSWPAWVPTPGNRRFGRAQAALDGVVNGIIAERRAGGAVHDDLLGMLMSAQDSETGEAMSDEQLHDEAMTMFLAGHETTANALGWTFYLLSLHPEVERKLRAEVTAALGGRRPTLADLERLPYTDRVIKESMRLYPPIWVTARSANEDDAISGYHIPKGSWVFMSQYLTHRDPRFWENPEGFDPDRFLPEAEAARPKHAYFPFAAGPRKCIGESFAVMEARLILASIVQRAKLSIVPGFRAELDPTITLRPQNGLWMTARAA